MRDNYTVNKTWKIKCTIRLIDLVTKGYDGDFKEAVVKSCGKGRDNREVAYTIKGVIEPGDMTLQTRANAQNERGRSPELRARAHSRLPDHSSIATALPPPVLASVPPVRVVRRV